MTMGLSNTTMQGNRFVGLTGQASSIRFYSTESDACQNSIATETYLKDNVFSEGVAVAITAHYKHSDVQRVVLRNNRFRNLTLESQGLVSLKKAKGPLHVIF